MNKFFKLTIALALSGYCFLNVASSNQDDLSKLAPEAKHQTSCSRIFNYFTRAHYKIIDVNDDFAKKVIDRYLSFLDYSHSLYTQPQVDGIYANTKNILNALEKCELNYPFAIYKDNIQKRSQKYQYFVDNIQKDLDVDADDYVRIDGKNSPFSANDEELLKLWSSELKNEYVSQRLSGKSDEEAKNRVKRRYEVALSRLSQITSEDVYSSFENAFATAIDPHTNYFGPVESENFNDDMNLSLEGIGAVLTQEDEFTQIQSIIPGSPAERSRMLKAKDKIVGVKTEDGKFYDVIGWRINDVVKKIKGKKGSKVTLEIERDDGTSVKSFDVTLVRDKIHLQDREAKSKIFNAYNNKKIGVITISSFYTALHNHVKREVDKLKAENVDAIVVDLRNNGGGLLDEAVSTTGLFIKSGPVVQVRDLYANEAPIHDEDEAIEYTGPLVMLINRLTASSSEIMSAALQDYGRAIVLGDQSFGKGTVQQARPLTRLYDLAGTEMGSIHYTIAKFYRINGGSTQLEGVTPDIILPVAYDISELGEKNEPNALKWDSIKPATYDRYYDLKYFIPSLRSLHQARIAKDPLFKLMDEEKQRYQELKEKGTLTVNYKKRKEIYEQDEKQSLINTNIRLKEMGLAPIKKLKDLEDGFEFDDPILKESVNIAADYAQMVEQDGSKSIAQTPLLKQYPIKD